MKTLTLLQVVWVSLLLTVYISSVELHSIESEPEGKRCIDSCQCPNGTACLPEGNVTGEGNGKIQKKRCQLCQCRSNTQCIKRFNEVLCDCSNSGYTGTFCETEIPTCPAGWSKYENNCYLFVSDPQDWQTAYDNCVDQDAYLVEVTSQAELDFVATLSEGFWLGLTDRFLEGIFLFENSNNPPTFVPQLFVGNSADRDCVFQNLLTESQQIVWDTQSCSSLNSYVCEQEL